MPSVWLTCVLGISIVFAGLLCLVLICSIMGMIFKGTLKTATKPEVAQNVSTPNDLNASERGKLVAAASAAIAESLGKNVNAIRIVSFKKK